VIQKETDNLGLRAEQDVSEGNGFKTRPGPVLLRPQHEMPASTDVIQEAFVVLQSERYSDGLIWRRDV